MNKLTFIGIPLSLLLGLVLSTVGLTTRAVAADFIVTSNDEAELRIAIDKARVLYVLSGGTQASTITFAANVTGTITLTAGELEITTPLTIIGPGANLLTISGNNASRVFSVLTSTVLLDGLTVTGGNGVGATGSGQGGGIYSSFSTLTVSNSTVSGNSATYGGGIEITGGTVKLINSTVSGNSANFSGGINNSATLTLTNSTVSGNSASAFGGGIINSGGATLTVTNSTISGNRSMSAPGGGIAAGGTETLNNTIVAGNFLGAGTLPDDIGFGTIDTASNNLIGDAATAGGITNGVNGNKVGNSGAGTIDINSVLNTTLANNGGPTLTHALVPGGPAYNAGSNALSVNADSIALTTDQRGAGFPRIFGGTVDIGAFEVQSVTGFNFTGFFQPLDNSPIVNVATAGSAIPVKFSLGGYQGMAIFWPGYPASQLLPCSSSSSTDVIEEVVTAGTNSLSYDATTDQYKYAWKTDKAWKGQCRMLVVKLTDGSTHEARFQFK